MIQSGQSNSSSDHGILVISLIMAGFGVLMVYDSSAVSAAIRDKFADQYYFFFRQVLWLFVGILSMILMSKIPIDALKPFLLPALLLNLILLVLVLVPGIGVAAGGARRWLRIGPVSLQPGEPLRLLLLLYLAAFFDTRRNNIRSFSRTLLPASMIAGFSAILLIVQPKVSSALLIIVLTTALFFVAGVPIWKLFLLGLSLSPLMLMNLDRFHYISQRLLAWIDPSAHVKGLAYQSTQSLIAIGSGGFLGVGLGQGRQKMFYLPEAHTDFIFSVIGEELGLLGTLILLSGFGYIFFRGLWISKQLPDFFHKLVAFAMTTLVIFPVFVNTMVATGLFPVTGVPLPLISFGGSALVTEMTSLGILAGLARKLPQ